VQKQHIQLAETDRQYLEELLGKGSLPVKTFRRAQALLELDRGKTLEAVAGTLGVTNDTVAGWRNQYRSGRLSFLDDKPRSGRPVVIEGEQRARITALACSAPPQGHGRWSLRLLADKAVELEYCDHLSYVWAGEILKKTS
jgi:transposase